MPVRPVSRAAACQRRSSGARAHVADVSTRGAGAGLPAAGGASRLGGDLPLNADGRGGSAKIDARGRGGGGSRRSSCSQRGLCSSRGGGGSAVSYLLGLGPSLEKLLFFLGFVTRPTGSSSESSSKKGSSSSSFLAAVRFFGIFWADIGIW